MGYSHERRTPGLGRGRASLAFLIRSVCPLLLAAAVLLGLARQPAPPTSGTIEGQVTLRDQRSRLARGPYPAGAATRRAEPMPVVAMLVGTVPGAPSPGASAAATAQARVVQRDTSFHPAVVIVRQGATVAFPNDDPFFHNVFSYSRPRRFDLGRYPRGESKSVRFESPGVVKVFCEIHNWMRSAVVVTENPFHAMVGEDGRFRIANVPPGRHRLRVWHFDRGESEIDVSVPEAGTVRVEITL